MKFPYKLSKQRQSLLSPEDREIYEFEHSPFYSYTDKINTMYNQYNIDDDIQENIDNLIDEEIYDILTEELLAALDDDIYECLGEEDYNAFYDHLEKNQSAILEAVSKYDINDENMLNEGAEGHDMLYWLGDGSWLGKLAGIGLLAIFGPIIAAYIAGKSKLAAKLLERYMNKLVEIVDDGVFKRRSIFDWFRRSKSKQLSGDQSRSCFRSIQEILERKICTNVSVLGKACGFVKNPNSIITNSLDGGLGQFKTNVIDVLDRCLNN